MLSFLIGLAIGAGVVLALSWIGSRAAVPHWTPSWLIRAAQFVRFVR